MKKSLISLILLLALTLTSCMASNAVDLTAGIEPQTPPTSDTADMMPFGQAITDFSVELLRGTYTPDSNTLISPLSVMYALAMTANGAENETRAEFEKVLGLDIGQLNGYLHDYITNVPSGEKYKLHIANSIWFRDSAGFSANPDFLQTNADYFGAGIFKAPFDSSTKRDINRWVKDNTDGMIPEILDEISSTAVMYLVNALSFEAKWQSVYEKTQVRGGKFTTEDGKERRVDMMYSDEYRYLDDGNAIGFMKYYDRAKYAFAALLPNEGMTVAQYLETLTGDSLREMLTAQNHAQINAAMPKFSTEYSAELAALLEAMGMETAFDVSTADFTGIGSVEAGNIFISRVLHRTYIEVGEQGTRAGAATIVEADSGSAAVYEPINITLDRPFVYMIVECESGIPIFVGTLMDVK